MVLSSTPQTMLAISNEYPPIDVRLAMRQPKEKVVSSKITATYTIFFLDGINALIFNS